MDVEVDTRDKDGKTYVNIKAKNPSAKHKAIPMPEHDVQPCVVFFDDENDEEAVKMLSYPVIKRLEMAEGWEDSAVKAQLEALGKLGEPKPSLDDEEEELPASKKPSPKKPSPKKPEPVEEDADEDDDNPFA